ncbi:DUF4426 domain-containing protein [Ketobacter sp. MCCC 1A13808]|uniref:DUF4426 domain-containing protein n=1 Tax=Ketobacter sp. MCCC 1A13808 TaxID=2602738 RepID=UPI0012EB06D0|nr:DUF4426 domain-containing protein [Ketobacter sp. MCCC 1A13808]MVF13664.1 DUF4426 domain-containing protein [Ketobacter sp. MCCC 1A13808]
MTTTLKITLASILAAVLLLATELAAADQYIEDDDYIVHYSAFNSTLLTAEVAEAYGLMRSRQRGLINISVQRKMPGGPPKAVMSQLKGFTGQLGGSEIPLDFKMVEEGRAIYYLAEFLVDEGDKLNFDIQVKPTPDYGSLKLSFSQSFFAD